MADEFVTLKESDCENHFLTFTHMARYRVSQILMEKKQAAEDLSKKLETYYDASDDFQICHDGEFIQFKPFIKWCQHNNRNSPFRDGLCPGLRMVQSTLDKVQTSEIIVRVVCKNNEYKKIADIKSNASHAYREFAMKDIHEHNIHNWTLKAPSEPCLPRSAELLSRQGYLIDNGITLAIKYELKFHRSAFDYRGDYRVVTLMEPISHEPSDLDLFEFDKLQYEVKSENRFVLSSSDGVRFCAHKNRLVFASDYFKGMFRENSEEEEYCETSEREMKMDISAECLKQILAYIYLGNVDKVLNESAVVEAAKAADKYLMNTLKTLCHSQLITFVSLSTVTLDQIIEYLWLAHETSLADLKKSCMEWLYDHWDTVKDEDDVKDLMGDKEGRKVLWEFMDYFDKEIENISCFMYINKSKQLLKQYTIKGCIASMNYGTRTAVKSCRFFISCGIFLHCFVFPHKAILQ